MVLHSRNRMYKNSAKQPLRSLVVNNNILNSYTEIAEAFNNFFGTVASDLGNEMQQTDGSSPTARDGHDFDFKIKIMI